MGDFGANWNVVTYKEQIINFPDDKCFKDGTTSYDIDMSKKDYISPATNPTTQKLLVSNGKWRWLLRDKPLATKKFLFGLRMNSSPNAPYYRNEPYSIYAEGVLVDMGVTVDKNQPTEFEYFSNITGYEVHWAFGQVNKFCFDNSCK